MLKNQSNIISLDFDRNKQFIRALWPHQLSLNEKTLEAR